MQFDIVLTNPPFQDSSHTEKKNTLWRKFLNLNTNVLLKKNGYLLHIVPSSWAGSSKLLKEYFLPHNILVINKDECKCHFPRIGSTFSYYILQKSPYVGSTFVINQQINKTITKGIININEILCEALPRDMSPISTSILKKVLDPQKQKLGVINACTHHNVKRKHFRKQRDSIFKYPIQNTPSTIYWFDFPHPDQGKPKIAIPTSTYFKNMIYITHGVTQGMCYFLIGNTNPQIALTNTNNKLFNYVNECFRYSNWNSVPLLRQLPQIPFNRIMSNNDIYSYFQLTPEEISIIEQSKKKKNEFAHKRKIEQNIDNKLKKTQRRIDTTCEIFTPHALVCEILDYLPDMIFKNGNKTFCDPAVGNGAFLCEVVRRLLKNNIYKKHILSQQIFGVDIMMDNVMDTIYHLIRTSTDIKKDTSILLTTERYLLSEKNNNFADATPEILRQHCTGAIYKDKLGKIEIKPMAIKKDEPIKFVFKVFDSKNKLSINWSAYINLICADSLSYDFIF